MRHALKALCTIEEMKEVNAVLYKSVKLKRTFDMTLNGVALKFWRVIGPGNHMNLNSDLSLDGLRDWGIIR